MSVWITVNSLKCYVRGISEEIGLVDRIGGNNVHNLFWLLKAWHRGIENIGWNKIQWIHWSGHGEFSDSAYPLFSQ